MDDGTSTVYDVLAEDAVMADLIERHGRITLDRTTDPFGRLVTSIINQQLSTTSAKAIRDRVFGRFDITPEGMYDPDNDALRDCGLSHQKIAYITAAAEKFLDDGLGTERFDEMSDTAIIEELTEIHGIGVWTAKMFLISVLARPDVFPVEDLGIRHAMEAQYGIEDREAMRQKARDWEPYRSYASQYLWCTTDP